MGSRWADVAEVEGEGGPPRARVPLALALVAIGVVIVLMAAVVVMGPFGTDHDEADGEGPSQAALAEAADVCTRHGGATRGGARLDLSVPTDAGAVTGAAKAITGTTLSPWGALPAGHYVARCGYEGGTTSTSVCPNGEVRSAAVREQVLVDREGRVTPDLSMPPPPCRS